MLLVEKSWQNPLCLQQEQMTFVKVAGHRGVLSAKASTQHTLHLGYEGVCILSLSVKTIDSLMIRSSLTERSPKL